MTYLGGAAENGLCDGEWVCCRGAFTARAVVFGGVSWARFLLKLVLGDSGLSGAEARPLGVRGIAVPLRFFARVQGGCRLFLGRFLLLAYAVECLYW